MLLPACLAAAEESVSKTPQGLLIRFGEAQVECAAVSPEVLRLSVFYDRQSPPAASSFLADTNLCQGTSWKRLKEGAFVGIKNEAGRLLFNPLSGEWTLQTSDGKTLIPKHAIGELSRTAASNRQIRLQLGWDKQSPIAVYGCGNGVTDLLQGEGAARVFNGGAVVPHYWSKAGYAVLAVTDNDNHPASWRGSASNEAVTWTFPGSRADLYLMPAPTLKAATKAYARLTGAAPVPPRWTFGYLQSRWGWTNRVEVEEALNRFQTLKIPVDAFIFDFEWYTRKPDYELADQGEKDFADFGWNPNLFPDLAQEIKTFNARGVRFVAIRKPRLGNQELLAMARAKGWDLQSHTAEKVAARDLDFGLPEVREWYIQQSAGLHEAGVAAWWNDEGESAYTTYFNWNLAERIAMDRYRPKARLWTLNRAYSPGTQRFGAATWTGDINSSWDNLAATPAHLLNWSLAGMPYGACDIGGFFGNPSDELITRWMEAGVFFPIMRTHSEVHYQPHLPWLYGTNAQAAMHQAIALRYRLLPYYYSLAHETFATGLPLMRPLVMEFPEEPQVANRSDEWLMGDSLLAAPLLKEGGKRSVYLPQGGWYVFGTNRVVPGGRSIEITAALEEIPAYVRAGTILPLGTVIQNTTQQPGGPLEVQVYPGKDATFTLVEDNGETQDYLRGETRRTVFQWEDGKRRLKWKREGNYAGKNVFLEMRVVVLEPKGISEATCALTASGSVKLKPQTAASNSSRHKTALTSR